MPGAGTGTGTGTGSGSGSGSGTQAAKVHVARDPALRVDLFERLHAFKADARWRAAILLVNLGGIAYGFYYYLDQFAVTPIHLWIFVPDSPLAVLWAQAALVAYHFGKRWAWLDALAFVANVQVGLWTAYVLVQYDAWFETWTFNLNFWLLWLHLGMVALAGVFVHDLRRDARFARGVALVAAWVLANDVVDYTGVLHTYRSGCHLRPFTVPCTANEPILAGVTFGLTLGAVALLAILVRAGPPPRAGAGRERPPLASHERQ